MCDDHPDLHGEPGHGEVSRRALLAGLVALTGASFLPLRPAQAAPLAQPGAFTGSLPVRAAMHVHGSWSEGLASWEAQCEQASREVDLLCMSDHDFRARAHGYLKSLDGVPLVAGRTGRAASSALERSGGSLRLRVSSTSTAPATVRWSVQEKPVAWNRLRTSISGHVLSHAFGPSHLDPGARYEVVVSLSKHPAGAVRPAGQLTLVYRFGEQVRADSWESGGLTGVVGAPLPPAGSVAVLDLVADAQRLWPDVHATDNALTMVAFVASSHGAHQIADVAVQDVRFTRSRSDEASVVEDQARLREAYQARFPGLAMVAGVEVSRLQPHVNLLGGRPRFLDQRLITQELVPSVYRQLIADTRAEGGISTWNHVLGVQAGPLQEPAAGAVRRSEVFTALLADRLFGAEVLEVGYRVRGGATFEEHLALWDTLSRHRVFVTGNGANDDHSGKPWRTLQNGFTTGIWAGSASMPDVVAALRAGRAYTGHPGEWPHGHLDVLVDDSVPMGGVSVGDRTTRSLAVTAANLPPGSRVEVVVGPADSTGVDPGTVSVAALDAGSFGVDGTGTVGYELPTPASCFVRTQVRSAAGRLVGTGNPVWLLHEEPPEGVPVERRA